MICRQNDDIVTSLIHVYLEIYDSVMYLLFDLVILSFEIDQISCQINHHVAG